MTFARSPASLAMTHARSVVFEDGWSTGWWKPHALLLSRPSRQDSAISLHFPFSRIVAIRVPTWWTKPAYPASTRPRDHEGLHLLTLRLEDSPCLVMLVDTDMVTEAALLSNRGASLLLLTIRIDCDNRIPSKLYIQSNSRNSYRILHAALLGNYHDRTTANSASNASRFLHQRESPHFTRNGACK